MSAISQLLLTQYQPNFPGRFWGINDNNDIYNNNNNNNINNNKNNNNNNNNNISSINDLILTKL